MDLAAEFKRKKLEARIFAALFLWCSVSIQVEGK